MKKLKVFKSTLALTTAVGITLLSGCLSKNEKQNNEEENVMCQHLIVEFGGQPVIFKECEGYDIEASVSSYAMYYEIKKEDNILITGVSKSGNYYETNHEDVDKIEEKAIEKGAYVYKLN